MYTRGDYIDVKYSKATRIPAAATALKKKKKKKETSIDRYIDTGSGKV